MDVPSDWKTWIWYIFPGFIFIAAIKVSLWAENLGIIASNWGFFLAASFFVGFIIHQMFRVLSYPFIIGRKIIREMRKDGELLEETNARFVAEHFSKNKDLVDYIKTKSIMVTGIGAMFLATLMATGITFLYETIIDSYLIFLALSLLFFLALRYVWDSMSAYEKVLKTLPAKRK